MHMGALMHVTKRDNCVKRLLLVRLRPIGENHSVLVLHAWVDPGMDASLTPSVHAPLGPRGWCHACCET